MRLLTTRDPEEAALIAAELDRLNGERRAIEASVQEQAQAMLDALHNCSVALVAGQGWHPGVIGIVAGRLKEKSGKPAIVIALDENGVGKGSGRSIIGVDLGAAILAAKDEGLLVAGGGHAMAAGLTIAEADIPRLAEFLESRLAADVSRAAASQALRIDLMIAPGGLTPDLVTQMEGAGPFGNGWPAPRVALGPVRIVKADVVGTDHVARSSAARTASRSRSSLSARPRARSVRCCCTATVRAAGGSPGGPGSTTGAAVPRLSSMSRLWHPPDPQKWLPSVLTVAGRPPKGAPRLAAALRCRCADGPFV